MQMNEKRALTVVHTTPGAGTRDQPAAESGLRLALFTGPHTWNCVCEWCECAWERADRVMGAGCVIPYYLCALVHRFLYNSERVHRGPLARLWITKKFCASAALGASASSCVWSCASLQTHKGAYPSCLRGWASARLCDVSAPQCVLRCVRVIVRWLRHLCILADKSERRVHVSVSTFGFCKPSLLLRSPEKCVSPATPQNTPGKTQGHQLSSVPPWTQA